MALTLGILVMGCEDETNYREESITLPYTSGEFTFTDIPAKHNGKFALLEGQFSTDSTRSMLGFKGGTIYTVDPDHLLKITCVKIENGIAKIPLYTFSSSSPVSTLKAYTGNDSAHINILIYDTENISAANIYDYYDSATFGVFFSYTEEDVYPVQFISGKASKSNNEAYSKLSN